MIKQIVDKIVYTADEAVFIASLQPFEGKKWELKNDELKNLKARIRTFLEGTHNNECAYCGHFIYGKGFIEHIAPRGNKRHPEFIFTEANLSLACPYCNGFDGKGATDTIAAKKANYEQCEFTIVHPYFDDPDQHFKWTDNQDKILIQSKTDKGRASIVIFNLAQPKQSELRARDSQLKQHILGQEDEKLVQDAIKKNGSS